MNDVCCDQEAYQYILLGFDKYNTLMRIDSVTGVTWSKEKSLKILLKVAQGATDDFHDMKVLGLTRDRETVFIEDIIEKDVVQTTVRYRCDE